MATNPLEAEQTTPPMMVNIVRATHEATGTDARLTLRLLFALLVIAVTGSTAPFPYALFFMAALVVVSVEVARLAWKK